MKTILSMPGKSHANRYFAFFCDSLEAGGLRVVSIRDPAARLFRFDVLHIHFPTHFLTETTALRAVLWSFVLTTFFLVTKLLRKPIVYTVHNVVPFHAQRGWLLGPYLTLVHHLSDAFVFLSKSSQAEFYARFPAQRTKRCINIDQGPYPVIDLTSARRRAERLALAGKGESLLVGFLGTIKPYKNLEALAFVPARLAGGRAVKLLVAGRIEAAYAPTAQPMLDAMPAELMIRIDRFVSDEELDRLIQIADVFLLPYSRGWNSSAALLALSNRARIVASSLPVFKEIEQRLGAPWVYCFDHEPDRMRTSLAAVLERVATEAVDAAAEERLTRFLEESSFAAGTRRLKQLYDETSNRRALRPVTP